MIFSSPLADLLAMCLTPLEPPKQTHGISMLSRIPGFEKNVF